MDNNCVTRRVAIYPQAINWYLIWIIISILLTLSLWQPEKPINEVSLFWGFRYWVAGLLLCMSVLLLYLAIKGFYSRIIVKDKSIILPITEFNGQPSIFSWGRGELNIDSIKKIKRYPQDFSWITTFGMTFAGSDSDFGKITLVCDLPPAIAFSNFYFGEQQLNRFIVALEERNPALEVVNVRSDYFLKKDHLFFYK